MGFDSSIKKRISEVAKNSQVEENQIYTSEKTKAYLEGVAGTLLNDYSKPIKVYIAADGPDGFTAFTNGTSVNINYQNSFASRYCTAEARFDAFMGFFFHEMSHVLYLDFEASRNATKRVSDGCLFGEIPTPVSDDEKQFLNEMQNYLGDKIYRKVFVKVFADLENTIIDRHDEDMIMSDFPGITKSPIMKVRESLLSYCPPYEEHLEEGDPLTVLGTVFDCILQYSRFGTVFMYDESLWNKDDLLMRFKDCCSLIDDAVCDDTVLGRYKYFNRIVLKLWPFIKAAIDHLKDNKDSSGSSSVGIGLPSAGEDKSDESSDTGSKGNSGEDSDNTENDSSDNSGKKEMSDEEVVQKILEEISKQVSEILANKTPQPKGVPDDVAKAATGKGSAKKADPSAAKEEQTEDMLKAICAEVAQEIAEDIVSDEIATATQKEVMTVDQNSTHKGVPIYCEKHKGLNPSLCADLTLETKQYTKRMVKEVQNVLEELKKGSITKHKHYGKKLIVSDTYRTDNRCFANKKLPEEFAGMAISILVDNSGSMTWGNRIPAARRAALLLYDFATALGIPVCVAGHTTRYIRGGEGMHYITYADYERAGLKDRERIADMDGHSSNRDGMALEIAASLLSKRTEPYKLLIIISDGQPAASGYGGQSAINDIKSICSKYRKRGVELIAAAIGDDRETIHEIYGDDFLDVSDLTKMPKQMARMVYNRVMKQLG